MSNEKVAGIALVVVVGVLIAQRYAARKSLPDPVGMIADALP